MLFCSDDPAGEQLASLIGRRPAASRRSFRLHDASCISLRSVGLALQILLHCLTLAKTSSQLSASPVLLVNRQQLEGEVGLQAVP